MLVLNVYPALTVAASTAGNVKVKLAAAIVLTTSGLVVSLLEGFVPSEIHVPTFVMIITSFMAIMRLLLRKFVPGLCSSLKVCVPLVMIGYVVLKHTRTCTSGGGPVTSLFSNVNVNLKFALDVAYVNTMHRLVNTNSLFKRRVLPLTSTTTNGTNCRPVAVFVLTPKTFFILTTLSTLRGGFGVNTTGHKVSPDGPSYNKDYTTYNGAVYGKGEKW